MTHKYRIYIVPILMGLLALVALLHLSILLQLIPYTLVWGGQLAKKDEMYTVEFFSLACILFLMLVLAMHEKYIKAWFSPLIIRRILRVYMVFFVINSVGNLLSENMIEKSFSMITLIFSYLLWRIQQKPSQQSLH